jgi:uncharacterized protein YlxW (UPF0749 family)
MTAGRLGLAWRRPASWQVALAGALLALGFLVAVQLQSQSPRARYTTQERPPLVATALELTKRQDDLEAAIVALREQIEDLETGAASNDAQVAAMNARLQEARSAAGLLDMSGPGAALQLDDAPGPLPPGATASEYRVQAEDLRDLVAALWLSGADAIAINGERIVAATAITDIGGTVLVNSAYLAPPYVVTAVGDPSLYDQLVGSDGLRILIESRVQPFGLRLGAGQLDHVVIPAYAGGLRLVEARPTAGPAPTPSAGATP